VALQGGELKGQILLQGVDDIKHVVLKKKVSNCFEVQTPHRYYHLAADSEALVYLDPSTSANRLIHLFRSTDEAVD
jgi:hypothetical protein